MKRLGVLVAVPLLAGPVACGSQVQRDEAQHVSVLAAASPTASADPLAAACGHPGATVEVPAERRTVKHADCDLTGVVLSRNGAGATVPVSGGVGMNVDGPTGGQSVTIMRDDRSGDITYETRGAESDVEVSGYVVLTGGPAGTPESPAQATLRFDSEDGSNGGDATRADGSFTEHLWPGHYVLTATTPSYDGGKTPCIRDLVVGTEPLNGVRIECHRT